jgi:hypothetical protein
VRFDFFVGYIFSILINLQLKKLWFLVMSFIWFIAPTCFKALLLLQHHNNMSSSIIHALFWLISFSFFFLAKLFFRTRYNWWEPTMVAWWYFGWQRCIQILWRKWWFPTEGWVSCRLAWTSFLPGAIYPAYQRSCQGNEGLPCKCDIQSNVIVTCLSREICFMKVMQTWPCHIISDQEEPPRLQPNANAL